MQQPGRVIVVAVNLTPGKHAIKNEESKAFKTMQQRFSCRRSGDHVDAETALKTCVIGSKKRNLDGPVLSRNERTFFVRMSYLFRRAL
jgi:hypothetical protein